MSIDTELARLTNAKLAIKAAIEGKGVTVPDGTLLDGMASLIEAIEAGGGIAFSQCKFTPSENLTTYEIQHNLGHIPDFVLLISDFSYTKKANRLMMSCCYTRYKYYGDIEYNNITSYKTTSSYSHSTKVYDITSQTACLSSESAVIYGADENKIIFGNSANKSIFLQSAVPYLLFVAKTGLAIPY